MKLIDVAKTFQNDDDCLAYMEFIRWPDGVIRCPICNSDHVSKIVRKSGTVTRGKAEGQERKNKRTRLYQCLKKCTQSKKTGQMVNNQFSATSGTLFNDSHLPLTTWLMALAIIVDAKKSISAKQLQEHLSIGSYRTAWYMAHRIRKSMVDPAPTPLKGVVEIDETYLGGRAIRRFQKDPKPRPPKDVVLGMRERSLKGNPGRVRYFHVPDAKLETLRPIVEANVADFPTMKIYTDSSSVYDIMFSKGTRKKSHRMVNHSQEWVVPGTRVHTNTVESSFSLLKRGLIGSFHRVSIKHLHRYLSEFEYRFNERKNGERFEKTLGRMLEAAAMPYETLVSPQ